MNRIVVGDVVEPGGVGAPTIAGRFDRFSPLQHQAGIKSGPGAQLTRCGWSKKLSDRPTRTNTNARFLYAILALAEPELESKNARQGFRQDSTQQFCDYCETAPPDLL